MKVSSRWPTVKVSVWADSSTRVIAPVADDCFGPANAGHGSATTSPPQSAITRARVSDIGIT